MLASVKSVPLVGNYVHLASGHEMLVIYDGYQSTRAACVFAALFKMVYTRLVFVRNMKRQLEIEDAMLPVSRLEQLTISKGFLKNAINSLEEEEIYLKKELNKTQQPITYLDTSQHKQEAEVGDVQGRCFASTSNHKRFRDESNLSGNSSFLYSQHLPMIEEGLYQHERRMRGDDLNMSPMQGLASRDQHALPNAREKGKGVHHSENSDSLYCQHLPMIQRAVSRLE